ncbi:response regulator [Pseudooceanicola sp. C21-150M6]|uniref:response regulator n=1 Tax=Pseudooceanicola sp. C21-150M6 TaxID=3434355 RepID=UPI003D7FB29B
MLIVDDSEEYVNVFRSGLEALGHQVSSASQADAAMEQMAEAAPEIIFLDVVMRGGGALTLVHEIRKIDRTTPIVIISGVSGVILSPLFQEGFALAQARVRKSASLYEINNVILALTQT